MDTREWVIVMALGVVVAAFGPAMTSGSRHPVDVGIAIFVVGFIGWQVTARLALRRDPARAPKPVDQ